jgi:hypothetical protein
MKKWILIRCLVPLALLALLACGNSKAEKEKAVATVNGAQITKTEIQQAISGYGKSNRVTSNAVDDQLHLLIENKLLIQEAIKMGLPENKKFAETIKTFWEQTIIRNLIEAKTAEWSDKTFATDREVADEYERMKCRPRIRAIRGARTKQEADEIVRQMQNGKPIPGEENIGPLFYEDVKGSPLANAFDMKKGQIGVFPADEEYIVIGVTGRGSIPLPPLKQMGEQIRQSILVQKKEKALVEWIAAVKKAASIQIDEKELRSIDHE